MGSPLTASICRSIANYGLPAGQIFDRLSHWNNTGTLEGDLIALRLACALHRLVLDQIDEGLAAQYPPHELNEDALFNVVCSAVISHAAFIDTYLDLPPQTNEVGRSAILLPALLQLSSMHQLPFEIFELGASAGLNQGLAQFAYEYGSWRWGDPSSPVQLNCDWRGNVPPVTDGTIEISRTLGCDIAPVEIQTDAQRRRLQSYVWADQTERLSRLSGALSVAVASPPNVVESGAADWLSKVLVEPTEGRHSLIMHTIMWQYMPDSEQQACEEHIRRFAALSTPTAPVTWLRFEADGNEPGGLLTQSHWCGSTSDGVDVSLARADYHGKWIDWA